MKKGKKLWKNKKREITLILVNIMVLTLFFTGNSMGKGYSKTRIEANSKIAEPILVVENSPIIEMSGRKEKEYYDFKVKNYKENGEVTQIDLKYRIEILSQIEEPISFKLYRNKQEVLLQNKKTANIKLGKEKPQEDNYQLEIIYNKAKNNVNEDIVQEIQIKIYCEQVEA